MMPTKTKLRINKTLSKIKVSLSRHWKLPQINPIFANLFEEIPILNTCTYTSLGVTEL